MAGHSHWKQIKEHKGAADKRRGEAFSKLVRAITAAAKGDPNPQFNPRLRTTIDTARAAGVPKEAIERAVSRAKDDRGLEDVVVEAYAPGGVPLLIHAITTNKNRTIQELRLILKESRAKFAEPGSVRWAFEEPEPGGAVWKPKFPQEAPADAIPAIKALVEAIKAHDDVESVFIAIADQ